MAPAACRRQVLLVEAAGAGPRPAPAECHHMQLPSSPSLLKARKAPCWCSSLGSAWPRARASQFGKLHYTHARLVRTNHAPTSRPPHTHHTTITHPPRDHHAPTTRAQPRAHSPAPHAPTRPRAHTSNTPHSSPLPSTGVAASSLAPCALPSSTPHLGAAVPLEGQHRQHTRCRRPQPTSRSRLPGLHTEWPAGPAATATSQPPRQPRRHYSRSPGSMHPCQAAAPRGPQPPPGLLNERTRALCTQSASARHGDAGRCRAHAAGQLGVPAAAVAVECRPRAASCKHCSARSAASSHQRPPLIGDSLPGRAAGWLKWTPPAGPPPAAAPAAGPATAGKPAPAPAAAGRWRAVGEGSAGKPGS
jgi:hypothetical protein